MSGVFEVVELSNGDIELRRVDDEQGESLVKIEFSDETKAGLGKHKIEIAKAMLQAGMERVSELSGMQFESSDVEDGQLEGEFEDEFDSTSIVSGTLH